MDKTFQTYCNKYIVIPNTYTWYPFKSKTNIDIFLLHIPLHISYILTNIIFLSHIKPLQNIHNLILIKPTQYLSLIQILYHFCNHSIPQRRLTTPNPFNSRQSSHMGRYSYALMYPLSHILPDSFAFMH